MSRLLHTVAHPFKPSLDYSLQNVFPAPRPSATPPHRHTSLERRQMPEAPDEFRPEQTDSGQDWTVNGPPIPMNPDMERADTIRPVYHSGDSESVSNSSKPLQSHTNSAYILAFFIDTLPRQIYLTLLLRLPNLYYSRISRVFYEADISLKEIQEGILQTPPTRQYEIFKITWQSFANSVLQEWGTSSLISVVLLLVILATLSLPGAANDPLTRYTALISVIFTFMSLVYGCIYLVGFDGMRETHIGVEWVKKWQKSRFNCPIFWNDWVFLAMPAVFLAWSLITYGVCIVSFVWRVGIEDSVWYPLSSQCQLIPRIIASVILGIGIIYLFLIVCTFERYGAIKVGSMKQIINNIHRPLYSPTVVDNAIRPTEAPRAPLSRSTSASLRSFGGDTE